MAAMGEARGAGHPPRSGQPAFDPSTRCALDQDILELDLEPISYLVALDQPSWSLARLDVTELGYRCFLQLVRDYPGDSIAPSRDCDLYWHSHILALELYLEHCQALFGRPLLHYPFSGTLGPEDEAIQRARLRRCLRLHTDLMSRVLGTHHSDTTGEEHEPASAEVSEAG
jgi:hypothetical protein